MAKKSKDTTVTTKKKETKVKVPADPATTRNMIRLLNILALLLAITAFILQFIAVRSYYWKHQNTNLSSLLSTDNRYAPTNYYDDSRIDQNYGLFSRNIQVYANNDQQLDILASTRFPRLDNGDQDLQQCLARSATLRSSLLTCTDGVKSPEYCHCRRYPYWNAIIVFEIAALVLLGLVVAVSALLSTQYHGLLKLLGVALSFLSFLFLLVGLILLLSYLKRETRSIADSYPFIHTQLINQFDKRYPAAAHKLIRRETLETIRSYSLLPGQYPLNGTHFQEFSASVGEWVQVPYSSLNVAQQEQPPQNPVVDTQANQANQANKNVIGYDKTYENTRARIGCSAVLSILAMILALFVTLILGFSWISAKKLQPEVKTVTTTVKTEYVAVPQDANSETVPLTVSVLSDNNVIQPDPIVST